VNALPWYFDFISPFSYLQWRKLRVLQDDLAAGQAQVVPVPIVFGAVLAAHAHKGPAEIPGKREFTYRHVSWQAAREGTPLRFPPAHPFNPLAALRLCVAAGSRPEAVTRIFDWIWAEGRAGDDIHALAPVAHALGVDPQAAAAPAVKDALRANTEAALAAGVFGVPTLDVHGQLFWGNDAHEFALAVLREPALLDTPEMRRVGMLPVGVRRG
jgi:2-hydroxychromene-2-carboxylate isomerase